MKKLDILVVEDNPKFVQGAREYLDARAQEGPVTAKYVGTLQEALAELQTGAYNAVMSDVFFPESEGNYGSRETLDRCDRALGFRESSRWGFREGETQAYEDWLNGNSEAPLGVLVAEQAFERGLSTVLVTSTDHHGSKTQPM